MREQPWTTANMPDLRGKVAIVTGANSGLGFETAKELIRKGAQTIMACRNMEKARTAQAEITGEITEAGVEIMQLDLASLASVRRFAHAFRERYARLDLLINNAGIMMVPYGQTEDGFERQLGTNHLGHFALTGLLFDLLVATPGARVVNVSSNGHRSGKMDFDNLMYQGGQGYSPMGSYGRSKLANLLFTKGLQSRFEARGSSSLALAAHPGASDSNLAEHLKDNLLFQVLSPLFNAMMQSAAMGALPTLRAATDPTASGGEYFGPGGFMQLNGYPERVQSNQASHSESDARQLWDMSEELTGVAY